MLDEGSAVSISYPPVLQVRDVYYWKGAVLTVGSGKFSEEHDESERVIEIQKDTRDVLDELVLELRQQKYLNVVKDMENFRAGVKL